MTKFADSFVLQETVFRLNYFDLNFFENFFYETLSMVFFSSFLEITHHMKIILKNVLRIRN
jgi:hypothetical protein